MSTSLPNGYVGALHPITVDDHGGYASIGSGCTIVFVLMFAAIRLWNCNRIGWFKEDFLLCTATAFGVLQSILVLVAVDEGFGKTQEHLNADALAKIRKFLYTSDQLYIAALFSSKLSIQCLIMRMSVERRHVIIAKAGLTFSCAALVASFVMIALGCGSKSPWKDTAADCSSLYTRWIAVEILGIVAELLGFLLIGRIYINLQTKLRSKIRGPAVFGLRLLVVVLVVYRLRSLRAFRRASDPSFAGIDIVSWTSAELAYSLITATIPCLLPFMGQLNTAWGTLHPRTVIEQSQLDSQVTGGSYKLRSLPPTDHVRSHTGTFAGDSYKWAISAPPAEQRSIASDDSTGQIIRRVDFSATTEPVENVS